MSKELRDKDFLGSRLKTKIITELGKEGGFNKGKYQSDSILKAIDNLVTLFERESKKAVIEELENIERLNNTIEIPLTDVLPEEGEERYYPKHFIYIDDRIKALKEQIGEE